MTDSMKELNCRIPIDVWSSNENSWETCRNGLAKRDLVLTGQECAVSLGFNDTSIAFNITGFLDGIINYENRTSTLRFSVSTYAYDSYAIWKNISIPEIKVSVVDSDVSVAGMLCTSYNDPHMTTFDGEQWDNHLPGEFVLYKHKYLPYSVNVLFSSCVAGSATCNCGVSVRSNYSLYVVRTCAQVSFTQTELLTVPYERLTLNSPSDLYITKSGGLSEVIFPSGTRVSFDLSYDKAWISSVRVQASVLDVGSSEGMCGLANRNENDDFIPRQGNNSKSTDNQEFALSWRIPLNSNESLFSNNPDFPVNFDNYQSERYSLCKGRPDETGDSNIYNIVTPSMFCMEGDSVAANLASVYNQSNNGDFVDALSYDPNYNETETPQVPGWTNGWTESSARTFCVDSFNNDVAINTCGTMANVSSTSYVESCVADIQLSGNTTYLLDSLNTLKGVCSMEVMHNEVYYVEKSGNGKTLVDVIMSLLCPQNCSGNGNCASGICECYGGFIGSDCSTRTSSPPEIFILPFQGLCHTGSGSCQNINMIGYFHSENIWTKLSCFTISSDGTVTNTTISTIQATYRHFNLISIELPMTTNNAENEAARGCNISLSYDGISFSNHQTFLMYDKQQYNCDLENLTCIRKALETRIPDDSDRTVLIAAVAVCFSVVLIIAIIVIVKKCQSQTKAKEHTITSERKNSFSQEYLDDSMICNQPPRQHTIMSTKKKSVKFNENFIGGDSIISSHPPRQEQWKKKKRKRKSSFKSGDVHPQNGQANPLTDDTAFHPNGWDNFGQSPPMTHILPQNETSFKSKHHKGRRKLPPLVHTPQTPFEP
ncbi:von Willebrand factor D and EGF domain-containing protein-like isoform X2 [Ostrea edulis]|nr:von Willebrand factor D and EGF domain-containing protein-like isoform X2 [Ostrea edulis]